MPSKKAQMPAAAFVRSQPLTLSVDEVIARAKAAGISCSAGTVYNTRATMRKAAREGALKKYPNLAKPAPARVVPSVVVPAHANGNGNGDTSGASVADVARFMKLAMRLGVVQSQLALDALKER